ncbi:hypothetical protein KFE98_01055 [bacterium SCSIO 12741]|nr:hypothetical protein KFE98_01055 [bacterium SCSIO 12741]
MTFQEKRTLVTLASSVIIPTLYFSYLFHMHQEGSIDLTNNLRTWGIAILILIPIQIGITILNHIIFYIINRIVTGTMESYDTDERDKRIELIATRNSYIGFMVGYVLAMASLVLGAPNYVMFIVLISSGMFSSVINGLTELYFYRRGF